MGVLQLDSAPQGAGKCSLHLPESSLRSGPLGGGEPLAEGRARLPGLLPPLRGPRRPLTGPGPGRLPAHAPAGGRCPAVREARTDRPTDGRTDGAAEGAAAGRTDRRGSAGSGDAAGQRHDRPHAAAERAREPRPCALAFPRPGSGPWLLGAGDAQEGDRVGERLHHHRG